MKTMLRSLPVIFAAAALCGCGPGYIFQPYVGAQQNWQTGAGGYVKVVDNATLYAPGQYPLKHYIILGAVTTDSEENLAKAVHEQHADAALVSSEETHRSGSVAVAAPGIFVAQPLRHTTITANLIRFTN